MTDANWEKVTPYIPKTRGKSAINHRDFVEAVCWVAVHDGSWEKLPKKYGNWQTVKNRYRRWISCGYIESIVEKYLQQKYFSEEI